MALPSRDVTPRTGFIPALDSPIITQSTVAGIWLTASQAPEPKGSSGSVS